VDVDDVCVVTRSRRELHAASTREGESAAQVGPNQFHGYDSIDQNVARAIDDAHPASPMRASSR
jgi:hypothetical protein